MEQLSCKRQAFKNLICVCKLSSLHTQCTSRYRWWEAIISMLFQPDFVPFVHFVRTRGVRPVARSKWVSFKYQVTIDTPTRLQSIFSPKERARIEIVITTFRNHNKQTVVRRMLSCGILRLTMWWPLMCNTEIWTSNTHNRLGRRVVYLKREM